MTRIKRNRRKKLEKYTSAALNLATICCSKNTPSSTNGSVHSQKILVDKNSSRNEPTEESNKSLNYPLSILINYPWGTRTPAKHPKRQPPMYKVDELMRIDPTNLFFWGFLPPLFGALLSIFVALIFHYDEISNYNWQCGRAKFPSLSRIINLPMERIFWQMAYLFHIPIRFVEIGVQFFRLGRLRKVDCQYPIIFEVARYLYVIFGALELVFLIGVSIVGEREFAAYHVIFFYLFGSFALGFFITNIICHSQSLYYLNPYGRISYYIRIVLTIIYTISIPVLTTSFFLYWKRCITIMYDIFAVTEYFDVFLTIACHGCAFFDFRYKDIISIRKVKKIKPPPISNISYSKFQ